MKILYLPGILAMAAVVVASNILVQFLLGDWLTWGAFTYPIAFLVTDVMNRVYRCRCGAPCGLCRLCRWCCLFTDWHASHAARRWL